MKHKVLVKAFHCGGATYVLTKADVNGEMKYFAINYKYLDEEGRLKKTLNGLEMFMQDTMDDTMKRVEEYHKMLEYLKDGYSDAEAACLATMGFIPEKLRK